MIKNNETPKERKVIDKQVIPIKPIDVMQEMTLVVNRGKGDEVRKEKG